LVSNNYFTVRNKNLDGDQRSGAIRAVFRAVNILVCLSNGMTTITDIANCCKISKPTVYRLLKTLEELLLVTQDPISHRYYIGPLINQMASNPQTNHHYFITCALEELTQFWDFTAETVALNIMVGIQYIRLYEIPSKYKLKVIDGDDPIGPIYVGATAKVLLSQLDDEELHTAVKNININSITEHSVTDKKILISQAKEIRQQGYAISYGERIPGALCISAPIRNYFWPAALSVVGPESRIESRVSEFKEELIARAGRISENIAEYFQAKGVMNIEQMTTVNQSN
jgi:IclR family KDG regulon transcriptional repressor